MLQKAMKRKSNHRLTDREGKPQAESFPQRSGDENDLRAAR
jgi:hypothetical protein